MDESFKDCDSNKMRKSKAVCDRQNSEKLLRQNSVGPSSSSGGVDHGESQSCVCGHAQNCGKDRDSKTVIDRNGDISRVTENKDFGDGGKPTRETDDQGKRPRYLWKFCKYAVCFLAIITCSVLVHEYLVPYLRGEQKELVTEQITTERPQAERLVDSKTTHDDTFNWVTAYLDHDVFEKGMDRLVWKLDSAGGSGIKLTDDGCFRLPRKSVYEIYAKVTYEIYRNNVTGGVFPHYHNVQLTRQHDSDFLDKNILSAPYLPPNAPRVFQTSSLLVLGEFEPDDLICVFVKYTSLVYNSKYDNTVKIIQRGN